MNTSQLNLRIDELEIKAQFQEETIDSLNQALIQQQKDMLILKEQLGLFAKQLETYRQQQSINDNETPPHY
ncbi:SlyX family protein [Marinomonas posidonica]|uniref:SlyX family protein n=1 Tax=Marinomonas posidonica (strain CECT 7376 / NCIMB 14433 / IVIA-Po-181) TaxID=491952 RepID=F6CY42_MARPP|nr:SlyX family protein [Marinomonas posidonica]AEF55674.1 SlyX family protein [Marinomonas posidonica IVIA-Po-181]